MPIIREEVDIVNDLAFGTIVIKYIINIMTILGESNEAAPPPPPCRYIDSVVSLIKTRFALVYTCRLHLSGQISFTSPLEPRGLAMLGLYVSPVLLMWPRTVCIYSAYTQACTLRRQWCHLLSVSHHPLDRRDGHPLKGIEHLLGMLMYMHDRPECM